jgi:hypothetical protein
LAAVGKKAQHPRKTVNTYILVQEDYRHPPHLFHGCCEEVLASTDQFRSGKTLATAASNWVLLEEQRERNLIKTWPQHMPERDLCSDAALHHVVPEPGMEDFWGRIVVDCVDCRMHDTSLRGLPGTRHPWTTRPGQPRCSLEVRRYRGDGSYPVLCPTLCIW